MKQSDHHRTLSVQDYGPWLDAATIYEHEDGELSLLIEGGYSPPYDRQWYSLAARPPKSLGQSLGEQPFANPTIDQSTELTEALGVEVKLRTPILGVPFRTH